MKAVDLALKPYRLSALANAGTGPRVLALHGWLDNAGSFFPLAPFLNDLELVCLEFAGHGHSDTRPEGCRYHFDDDVFDALAAATVLGWDQFHLLGHSLGGAVASVLAAACPERVLSLSLIEGLGPLSAPVTRTAARWRQAMVRSVPRPRRTHPDREAAIAARAHDTDLDHTQAGILARRGLIEVDGGFQWRHDPRLTWPSPHPYSETQILDLLGAIECAVLHIHAEPKTRVLDRVQIQRRLAAVRRLHPYSLPGGHHVHMQCPERAATLIREHVHAHSNLASTD